MGTEFASGRIESLSDTAWLVAGLRAEESDRSDALFKDPFARILGGPKAEALVEATGGLRDLAWSITARTLILDELVTQLVRSGVDAVLNLACGLDARAYRLSLPPELTWVDADIPSVITYKQQRLANNIPGCHLEYASLDLRDRGERSALIDRVAATAKNALVITEGLLLYLSPANVQDLAADLHARPTVKNWLMDLYAKMPTRPSSLEEPGYAEWWAMREREGHLAEFSLDDAAALLPQAGWRAREHRRLGEVARAHGRTPPEVGMASLIGRLSADAQPAAAAAWRDYWDQAEISWYERC